MNHMTNLFIISTKTLPDHRMYVSYCFTMTDISIIGNNTTTIFFKSTKSQYGQVQNPILQMCGNRHVRSRTQPQTRYQVQILLFKFPTKLWLTCNIFQTNHSVSFSVCISPCQLCLALKSHLNCSLQLTFLNWDSGKNKQLLCTWAKQKSLC